MRTCRRSLAVSVITVLLLGAVVPAAVGESPGPAVYLFAPSDDYAAKHDPLIAEAAMRLVSAELAARHGLVAPFVPIDQQEGAAAGNTYPRVTATASSMPAMPHLRLKRSGNVFAAMASADGNSYVLISSAVLDVPARAYVGMTLRCSNDGKDATCVITDVHLNGGDFGAFRKTDLGTWGSPGEASSAGGDWTLKTFGYQINRFDPGFSGLLVYRTFEGDFELDLTVKQFEAGNIPLLEAGAVCLSSLDFEHPGIAALCGGKRVGFGLCTPPLASMRTYWDQGMHMVKLQLATGPERSRQFAAVSVSCVTWQQLVDSTAALAEGMKSGLARELSLDLARAADPTAATGEQLQALDEARREIMKVNSGAVLAASRRIDQVLNASPACPQAHYTAALPAAILACQDQYGVYHQRGRFLAGPVSHWMLGTRLSPPERPVDRLSGAWVMLACGYPRWAMEVVSSLPQEAQDLPEAKAMRMFITHDYRPLTPQSVAKASPIEQVAWIKAATYCNRMDLLEEIGTEPALTSRSAAFVPRSGAVGVGAGHAYSELGIILSFARDSSDLLAATEIPEADRLAIATEMAGKLSLPASEDLGSLARKIAWTVVSRGSSEGILPAVGPLMDLYRRAMEQPGGPVTAAQPARLRCLPIHDFAELQRGFFLRLALDRIRFVLYCWGVPDAAGNFCTELAEQMKGTPELFHYYHALGLYCVGKYDEAAESVNCVLKSPFGKLPMVTFTMVEDWPSNKVLATEEGKKIKFPFGRGAWEWERLGVAVISDLNRWLSFYNLSYHCRNVNPYEFGSVVRIAKYEDNLPLLMGLLEKAPYDAGLLIDISYEANRLGQYDRAEQLMRRSIELQPTDASAYSRLAHLLINNAGRRAQAVEVAEQAMEKCSDTVCKSNLMGQLAIWLVEENRPKDALKWGEQAASCYSCLALQGYAAALAANGRDDEAKDVYRDMALRYCESSKEYLDFLFDHNAPDRELLQALSALAKEHRELIAKLAEPVAWSFQRAGRTALLEKVYAGPLAAVDKTQQMEALLLCAVYERDFAKVLDYARLLEQSRPLKPMEVVYAHMAIRLSGRTDQKAHIEEELRKLANEKDVARYTYYALANASAEQILKDNPNPNSPAYVHWMAGVEREIKGDLRGAAESYRNASRYQRDAHGNYIPAVWAKRLQEANKAASQPATSTAPTQGAG